MQHPSINLTLQRLDKLSPEDVAEMARQVADVIEHPGFRVIADLLDQAIHTQSTLVEGWAGVRPYEEMTTSAGKLQGFVIAKNIPDGVLEAGRRAEQALQQIVAAMEATA